jgi:hypothetical protein
MAEAGMRIREPPNVVGPSSSHMKKTKQEISINFSLTHEEIAECIGTSGVSDPTLSEFKRQRLVMRRGPTIEIAIVQLSKQLGVTRLQTVLVWILPSRRLTRFRIWSQHGLSATRFVGQCSATSSALHPRFLAASLS